MFHPSKVAQRSPSAGLGLAEIVNTGSRKRTTLTSFQPRLRRSVYRRSSRRLVSSAEEESDVRPVRKGADDVDDLALTMSNDQPRP